MFPLRFLFSRRRKNASKSERLERSSDSAHDERTDAELPESFKQVELAQIARHHEAVGLRTIKDMTQVPGLAISGGGIRSAVFSLGVLQALSDREILDKFGYLSTVSGGSYIGAFYGSMFVPDAVRDGNEQTTRKEFERCARTASTALNPETSAVSSDAVTPIAYLRDNCDYLAPNGTDDLLQSVAFALRNWFALQYVIGVSLLTILLFVGLADKALHLRDTTWVEGGSPFGTMPAIVASLAVVGVLSPLSRAYWLTQNLAQETRFFYKFLPTFSMISVLVLAFATLQVTHPETLNEIRTLSVKLPASSDYVAIGAWLVICSEILAVIYYFAAWWYVGSNPSDNKSWFPGSSFRSTLRSDSRAYVYRVRNALTNAYTNPLRFCGHSFLTGPAQLLLWAVAIACVDYLGYRGDQFILTSEGHWLHFPLIASSAAALWAVAKFLLAERKTITTAMPPISRVVLATVAAVIASMVTLVFWSVVAHAIERNLTDYMRNQRANIYGELLSIAVGFAFFFIVALIDGSCIQFLNLSTYQRVYSTRLTRAFLGATNNRRLRDRTKRDVTSLVAGDSISMGEYYSRNTCAPVHLINATVNKTIDWDSSLVQRGARGMSISVGPAGMTIGAKLGVLECNWACSTDISTPAKHVLRSRETPNIWLESLTLGDWIAISGAAIGTGLGQLTRRGYSLLMGIANIRLGYWWDTYSPPFHQGAENYPRTRVPLPTVTKPQRYITERLFGTQFCLLSELLGRFDGPRARRWNLSDGGHFENTGAYELLRRRLRFIVIVDNGADPEYRFDDVANLIRRVRVDFGIEVSESNTNSPKQEPVSVNRAVIAGSFLEFKFGKEFHAIRLITKFPDKQSGTIIVLKPRNSLDAPYDVRRYEGVRKKFPNESTVDQFFDDIQWESHRELGYSQACTLFARS